MQYPEIDFENFEVKLNLSDHLLNVLYVRFGYFHQAIHKHSHSNKSYELHYIPSGQGTLIVNNQKYPIMPGSLFMTGPDIAHEQWTDPEDPMAEYCICFELNPTTNKPRSYRSEQELEHAAIVQLLRDNTFWFGRDTQNMLSTFKLLSEETEHQYIGYYSIVNNIIEEMLIKLVRNYTQNRPSLQNMPLKTLDDKRSTIIEQSFLSDYSTITVKELANRLGLSVRQTERTLKNDYCTTFMQKRTEARLNAAAHCLVTTAWSIGEISARVGYSTIEHFCQSFKKHFQMTATDYRTSFAVVTFS